MLKAPIVKPEKPSPDFPLFAHGSRKWAKKISGKTHYFGRWDDPAGALAEYHAFLREQPQPDLGLTLQDACDLFLESAKEKSDSGILRHRTYADYWRTCRRLVDFLGESKLVEELSLSDFERYRSWRSETCNLVSVGNEVTRVKTVFRWLESNEVAKAPGFGPDFRKPSAKAIRRHRRESGQRLFTASQIRGFVAEAGVQMRAMILLGINCALGPSDLAHLSLGVGRAALGSGWLDYPRRKTEVERFIPLWSETLEAMRAVEACRYSPQQGVDSFFVMHTGFPWDDSGNPISKRFRAVRDFAGVSEGGFYWLRHTFATIGGQAKDQVAVNAIMGHVDSHISANYRHEIGEDRLLAVVNHVKEWLYGR